MTDARRGSGGFPTGEPRQGFTRDLGREARIAGENGRSQGERLLPFCRFWSVKAALEGKSCGNLPQFPLRAYNRLLNLPCVGSRAHDSRAGITPLGFLGIAQR